MTYDDVGAYDKIKNIKNVATNSSKKKTFNVICNNIFRFEIIFQWINNKSLILFEWVINEPLIIFELFEEFSKKECNKYTIETNRTFSKKRKNLT